MDKVMKMNLVELIRYFQAISREEFFLLLKEKDKLLQLEISKFNLLYLNISDELKKIMLGDQDLFEKLMTVPVNRIGKSVIDLTDKEVREFIYQLPYFKTSMKGKKLLEEHFRKLNREEFQTVLKIPNLNELYQRDLFQEIRKNFSCDSYQLDVIDTSIRNGNFSNLALFQLHHAYEVFLYAKFGLFVSVTDVKDGFLMIANRFLSYDFLKKVNRKHIVSLIQLMLKKEENCSDDLLLLSVCKLYMALGYDNSKKVMEDFFTYSTALSIRRASDELFKDTRREYRLKNQNKFYYYGMEYDFLRALRERDISFFQELCGSREGNWEVFLEHIRQKQEELDPDSKLSFAKNFILEEIRKREKRYYDKDTSKYQKYYQSMVRTKPITIEDIFQIFGEIHLKYQMNSDGKIIPNVDLNQFLLGNGKRDNDCLLRMVLNQQALGLNHELYHIMNHFDEVKEAIQQEKQLSMHSILDVIDVSKVFLYHLAPDELDMTLATLSKILNSRKYCTEDPEVILDRVMRLHKRRKSKISCAIPKIKGCVWETKYWMSDFDDERLLVSGIDTGSCFKVGGKGEEFLEYCLTSPKGMVFYMEYLDTLYVLPSTVNGNMLNINSIDPRISDKDIYDHLMKVIEVMAREVVDDSRNQIEIVTITDVHHEEFMKESRKDTIIFDQPLPLGTDIYCDYNKKEVSNYIVYQKGEKTKVKYFDNLDLFYQERPKPYIVSPDHEHDQERVEILINSISYASIDFMDLSEDAKARERQFFNPIDVNDFVYIIGSKDWFIGVLRNGEIMEHILGYDNRAKEEFRKYHSMMREFTKQAEHLKKR